MYIIGGTFMENRTYVRTDKNGTKYYINHTCPRCGGAGRISYYSHIEQGVCFQCGGTGHYDRQEIERTPEYEKVLQERRLAKARKAAVEANKKFLEKNGFNAEGETWVVVGNTYAIKDELKEKGAKFSYTLNWHFDHEVPEYTTIKMTTDEVCEKNFVDELYIKEEAHKLLEDKITALKAETSTADYVGNEGDKITVNLTFVQYFTYTTCYSYHGELNFIYKFKDENGNIFVWKTGKGIDFEEGKVYTISGTIKAHNEYKGEKQNVLSRCKVK